MTEEDKLIDFSCRLEESMRWLYATAAKTVAQEKASQVLNRLAAAEEAHLAALEEAFGVRLEDKSWSRPLGAYVRAHILKGTAPRIASDNVSQIVKTAYALEVGTGRFYRRWLQGSDSADVRRILPSLIEAESEHCAWVSECHEELVGAPLTAEECDEDLVDWPEL